MPEKKKSYRLYIEEELLSGKTPQEVFNDVVAVYDIKIHDAAEVISNTPTLAKRKKYKWLNLLLILLMGTSMMLGVIYTLGEFDGTFVSLFPGILGLMLLYGLINYKFPAHLVASILLTVLSVLSFVLLIFHFEIRLLMETIFMTGTTVLAYYLNSRLVSEYIYHPAEAASSTRENAVIFVE